MPEKPNLPTLSFPDAPAFEAWLAAQPAGSPGLWLKLAKAGNTASTLTKAQAIDAALIQGWIDGQLGALDDDWYLTRFTPRTAKSKWSAVNVAKAEALVAARRMAPAGLAEIERAKADGRWQAAYQPQSRIKVAPDLAAALAAQPAAQALFDGLDSANRYAILYRVEDARTPALRAKRIETLTAMLARGETIHPRRGKR